MKTKAKKGRKSACFPTVKPLTKKKISTASRARTVFLRQSLQGPTLQKVLKELADIKHAIDEASIVAITDKDGRIIYANDKFCEISKRSRAEILGQDHSIVNSGYHPKEFFKELWDTIEAGEVWRGEVQNKAKDGTLYWVDTTIVPFLDDRGKPYQYVAIRNEITKRKTMEEDIKALPKRILHAQEEERERIAIDIHDDLGQSLATLKMLIQSHLRDMGNNQDTQASSKIIDYLNRIIEKTRHLAHGLRPATLDVLGLENALKTLVDEFKEKKNFRIKYTHDPLNHLKFEGNLINLYRIVQEALTNIVKHSEATEANIQIKRMKNKLNVRIRDNGQGFILVRSDSGGPTSRGLGLSTMSERANLLGGDLYVESKIGKGTTIDLYIPVAEEK